MRIANPDTIRYLETIDADDHPATCAADRPCAVPVARQPELGVKAVLFPSLYEDFRPRTLDAGKLDTPVPTSTGHSISEAAGDDARLTEPFDADAIAEGIRALDTNAELRAEASAKGLAGAAFFSPDRFAAEAIGCTGG